MSFALPPAGPSRCSSLTEHDESMILDFAVSNCPVLVRPKDCPPTTPPYRIFVTRRISTCNQYPYECIRELPISVPPNLIIVHIPEMPILTRKIKEWTEIREQRIEENRASTLRAHDLSLLRGERREPANLTARVAQRRLH